jgi:hypothetical protein
LSLLCLGEGNNAKSVSRQYSLKVTKLEHEAEQAKVELTETRKQLQELESKDLSDVALKVKLQKEFRKKMDAAKMRVQVTYKIQPRNLTEPPCSCLFSLVFLKQSHCVQPWLSCPGWL